MRVAITRESTGGTLKKATLMRGDTENIIVRLTANFLDSANYTFKFTCKLSPSDADGEAMIAKASGVGISSVQVNDSLVEVTIPISSTDTSGLNHGDTLYYDIQMVTQNPASVRTLEKSYFMIEGDITQDNT